MVEPILSIVIPTRDRYYTLFNLVGKLMSWESDEFEVVVHDNTADNTEALAAFAPYQQDARLKYFHVAESLYSIDNYTRAFKKATGSYVCFLGDDDGIAFQAIAFTKWMQQQGIDTAAVNCGSYAWPGLKTSLYGEKFSGSLMIYGESGRTEILNPIDELKTMLRRGAFGFTRVPRAYHGIVSARCLKELYSKAGTYFPGPVADMSNAVGCCFYSTKHVYVDAPIIIAGASPKSMAGRGAIGQAHSKIEEEVTLPPKTAEHWSPMLPRYYAPQTIWPEGAIKALEKTGHATYLKYLDLSKIQAALIMYNPGLRGFFLKYVLQEVPLYKLPKVAWSFFLLCLVRLRTLSKTGLLVLGAKKAMGQQNLPASSIAEAMTIIEKRLEGRNDLVWLGSEQGSSRR